MQEDSYDRHKQYLYSRWNSILICGILFIFFLGTGKKSCHAQDIGQIKNQKPVVFGGGFQLGLSSYLSDGIEERRKPFSWILSGSPIVNLYGIALPFSFIISEQERDFRQPFNQYGVSPTYKWATAHLGYRNVTWSPYTLGGSTFLGAGIELNPVGWRLGYIRGRFNRAIAEDTLSLDSKKLSPSPAFRRVGYAAKLGFGSKTNYLDLIWFKSKDDIESLPYVPVKSVVLPSENVAIGISSKQKISSKLNFELEAAISGLTRDLRAEPIDEKEDPIFQSLKRSFTRNTSTNAYTAGHTSLSFTDPKFGLKLMYKRIDPDFQTHGTYYQTSDVEQITVNPNFPIFKKKVNVNASLGFQHDNLYKQKLATTKRNIGSLNLNIIPGPKYGIDAMYSNYGISQVSGRTTLNDSIKIAQVNNQITLSQRLTLTGSKAMQNFVLVLLMQNLRDDNKVTNGLNDMSSYTGNLNYLHTILSKNLSFTAAISYTIYESAGLRSTNIGPTIGINKQLKDNKINLGTNISYISTNTDLGSSFTTLSANINSNYQLNKKNRLSLIINLIKNNSTTQNSFTETRGDFGYAYIL